MAHEYGHFLDYVFGAHISHKQKLKSYALTGGRTLSRKSQWPDSKKKLHILMDDLMEKLFWKKPGVPSNFFKRLDAQIVKGSQGDYWRQRNEVFARAFEVFALNELTRLNITNHLLTKRKYMPQLYPTAGEMMALAPMFRRLVKAMREEVLD